MSALELKKTSLVRKSLKKLKTNFGFEENKEN
jgi:hypothetical protein